MPFYNPWGAASSADRRSRRSAASQLLQGPTRHPRAPWRVNSDQDGPAARCAHRPRAGNRQCIPRPSHPASLAAAAIPLLRRPVASFKAGAAPEVPRPARGGTEITPQAGARRAQCRGTGGQPSRIAAIDGVDCALELARVAVRRARRTMRCWCMCRWTCPIASSSLSSGTASTAQGASSSISARSSCPCWKAPTSECRSRRTRPTSATEFRGYPSRLGRIRDHRMRGGTYMRLYADAKGTWSANWSPRGALPQRRARRCR